jgi:hypothetical protein
MFYDSSGPSGRLKPCCTELCEQEQCETRSISLLPVGSESVTGGRDFQNAVSANVCRLVENCTVLYKHY